MLLMGGWCDAGRDFFSHNYFSFLNDFKKGSNIGSFGCAVLKEDAFKRL